MTHAFVDQVSPMKETLPYHRYTAIIQTHTSYCYIPISFQILYYLFVLKLAEIKIWTHLELFAGFYFPRLLNVARTHHWSVEYENPSESWSGATPFIHKQHSRPFGKDCTWHWHQTAFTVFFPKIYFKISTKVLIIKIKNLWICSMYLQPLGS